MRPVAEAMCFAETILSPGDAALPPDALDMLVLEQAGDAQHAARTCRMAVHEDPGGVANSDPTVKGVSGLHVADASVMLQDCRANTHSTGVMIGLMAAARFVTAERT
jgi:choline dehydrogenase-like flavoprotein